MNQSLLEKIASHKSLQTAWEKLNKHSKTSKGLSGFTIQNFKDSLDDQIKSISTQLLDETYRFRANRAVLIPKSKDSYRPLQVPEISDRLVMKAIAIELEEQFSATIAKSEGISFAYQKKLGVENAINKIKEHYDNNNKFVLEADLKNFFGTVDKNILLEEKIYPNLSDDTLNRLIYQAMNQRLDMESIDSKDRHYFKDVNKGIPQGNPLSPLFSNIYLSPFDLHIKDKGYSLVRYADDFVILCKTKDDCLKAYYECEAKLKELKLEIYSLKEKTKTKIVDVKNETFSFLSITFDGAKFYPSRENVNRLKSKIRDICHGHKKYNVLTLLTRLYNTFDGWISAYDFTKVEVYSKEIDFFINRQLYLVLSNFEWKFTGKSLSKLPLKYRQKGKSNECLSNKQRINSGIPLCLTILKEKRDKKNTPKKNDT